MVTQDLIVFAVVIGLRVVVPLFIPRFPLPAILAALVIDAVDQTVFQTFTKANLDGYQGYDKALDIYYLTIAFLSTFRNWTNIAAVTVASFLYFYRLVGVTLFETIHVRALLLFFPNAFEYFFIFVEVVRTRWNLKRLTPVYVVVAMWAIWVFVKIPQEYWIHIAKLDTTDVLKTQVFGVPADTGWGTIVVSNLLPIIAVLVALAWIVRLLWRSLVHGLPHPDWPTRLDAEDHPMDVTPEQVRAAAQRSAQRFFDGDLLEKTAMVTLVCTIFSKILPGLQATSTQVLVGTGVIVVANTVVSEFLTRLGVEWRSTVTQFLVTFLMNIGIVVAFNLLTGVGGASLHEGNTIFFLLLLSLMVALYDRYHPYYLAREALFEEARAEAEARGAA